MIFFILLISKHKDMYERKKTEEADYDAKIKNAAEMSSLSIEAKSMRFRRVESQESYT